MVDPAQHVIEGLQVLEVRHERLVSITIEVVEGMFGSRNARHRRSTGCQGRGDRSSDACGTSADQRMTTLQDIWAEGQGHHHEGGSMAGALAMSWGIVPIHD